MKTAQIWLMLAGLWKVLGYHEFWETLISDLVTSGQGVPELFGGLGQGPVVWVQDAQVPVIVLVLHTPPSVPTLRGERLGGTWHKLWKSAR